MMKSHGGQLVRASASMLACLVAGTAQAYVGPGAGLGLIGTIVAFTAAIFLAIVGFVWYPVKRVLRKRRQAAAVAAEQRSQAAQGDAEKGESYSR